MKKAFANLLRGLAFAKGRLYQIPSVKYELRNKKGKN
jgi:hypothetical protein